MEERIEKFGSGKKLKRFHNKKQRSNHKQQLKNMTTKDLQEENEGDWYEEFEKEEWIQMKQ